MKRQLYQCFNAKVNRTEVVCAKGHSFEGRVTILNVARGAPLKMAICETCLDYDEMGEPLSKEERGWAK